MRACCTHVKAVCSYSAGPSGLPIRNPQPTTSFPCLKAQETDMGYTLGDGIIVFSLAGTLLGHL